MLHHPKQKNLRRGGRTYPAKICAGLLQPTPCLGREREQSENDFSSENCQDLCLKHYLKPSISFWQSLPLLLWGVKSIVLYDGCIFTTAVPLRAPWVEISVTAAILGKGQQPCCSWQVKQEQHEKLCEEPFLPHWYSTKGFVQYQKSCSKSLAQVLKLLEEQSEA